jgi:inosose dehydratase
MPATPKAARPDTLNILLRERYATMKLRLGMSPISWSNDDLPQLGGDTPLEVCLSETREAGFVGTETGGKFPKQADALAGVLADHDLALVSGWYSGTLINNDLESELDRISDQLALFKSVGASVIVYGETYETVQNRQERPLSSRPKLDDFDVAAYGRRLTALAEHCAGEGVPLTFHHHMGTAVETEAELDAVMNATGEAVGLLLDTGHLVFAGGDNAAVIAKHGNRINHFHTKDIRADVLAGIDRNAESFLDCVLKGVFTVPGDGMIDYDDIMKRLFDVGYEGWVIIEAEQDPAKANPLEYAKMGYGKLHQALHDVGYSLA